MRTSTTSILAITMALAILLASCVERQDTESDAGDRPMATPPATETEEPVPDPTATEEPEPTEIPDTGENGDWYEQLFTDKTYPVEEAGNDLLGLAEDEEAFQELWNWFEFDEADQPEIDWDSHMILFAGTGESSQCPVIVTAMDYDEEERFLSVGAQADVHPDTVCTSDWTPRVFVIAVDRAHLGDGELIGLLYNVVRDEDISPEDGTVIREG